MGEIAEMILEGILCEQCGCVIEDLIPTVGEELLDAPGYPRNCEDCACQKLAS